MGYDLISTSISPATDRIGRRAGHRPGKIPIGFIRIEPRIVAKALLTGGSIERSDVRVLQVIYGFDHGSWPVYVGQEMDVYIDAPSSGMDRK